MRAKIAEKLRKPNKKVVLIVLAIDLILCLIAWFIVLKNKDREDRLYSQKAAERWQTEKMDCAEISIFYSEAGAINASDISSMRGAIKNKLMTDDYLNTKGDRAWIDAYSGHTFDQVRKDNTTMDVNIYTVGGDFFLIHTIPLISGSYPDLSASDANQILLDEYVAWNLFGTNDVEGKKVWIGNTVFTVTGVVKVATTEEEKQAYGNYYSVFVPMQAFVKKDVTQAKAGGDGASDSSSGSDSGSSNSVSTGAGTEVTCYEVVMPSPIKNYALNAVAEAAGIQFQSDEEKQKSRSILNFGSKEILDNTARYGFFNLLSRDDTEEYVDMKTNDIVYPYWENVARYEETYQRKGLNTILILLMLPILSVVYLIIWLYMHRGVVLIPFKAIKNKWEAHSEAKKYKRMEELQQKKKQEEEEAAQKRKEAEMAAQSGAANNQPVPEQESEATGE